MLVQKVLMPVTGAESFTLVTEEGEVVEPAARPSIPRLDNQLSRRVTQNVPNAGSRTEQRRWRDRQRTLNRRYGRPQLSGNAQSMAASRSASDRCRYLVVVAMFE